jgi:hypothetical protein
MRSRFVAIAVLAASGFIGLNPVDTIGQAQASLGATFKVTIAPPANPIHLDSPIEIKIIVQNISNTDSYWRSTLDETAYRAFRFSLKVSGKEPEATAFHRYLRNEQRPYDASKVAGGSSILSPVAPGHSFTFDVDLKRLYEITQPGTYTLSVSRFDEFTKTTSLSNTLTMNIVP